MLPRSILITGSNRGIGLEFVSQLTRYASPPKIIIAACRNPKKAEALNTLASKNSSIHVVKFDAKEESDHTNIVTAVSDIVGDRGLNVLINNAGMSSKFTRINLVKWEQMRETLLVNAISPLMLTKSLLPFIKTASKLYEGNELSFARAAVINMSSNLGSINDNSTGGFYPYRSSKAALNAIGKSMSIEFLSHNILVANIHPGWVKTDMGGSKAPLEKEDSIASMIKLFTSLTEKDHGSFISYDGEKLPY